MTAVAPVGSRQSGIQRDASTLAYVWLVTLVLSSLPAIIAVELADVAPLTIHWSALAAVPPLVALGRMWRPARPALRYLLVMVVVYCVAFLLPSLLGGVTGAADSLLGQAFYSKTIFLLVAALVAVVLVRGLRVTPRDAYLTPGDMAARSGIRLPGAPREVSWGVLGPLAAGALFTLLATMTWLGTGLEPGTVERLLPWLPLVVGCAAFNALGEEVVYRSGPLATLAGVVRPGQAVLLTSVWFGLAHYFGSVPEGLGGVAQSGALALLLGGAMVATKGLGWPVLVHFAVDLVVFASIAVVST